MPELSERSHEEEEGAVDELQLHDVLALLQYGQCAGVSERRAWKTRGTGWGIRCY